MVPTVASHSEPSGARNDFFLQLCCSRMRRLFVLRCRLQLPRSRQLALRTRPPIPPPQPANPSGRVSTPRSRRRAASNEHSTNCTSCHGTEKYTGDAFTKNWVGRTVFDLFDQLKTTMPDDNPGGLSAQQYKDIVAYILKINGLPSGTDSLPADPEAMRLIKIDAKPDKPSSPGGHGSDAMLGLLQSIRARPMYHPHVPIPPTATR